MKSSLLSAQAAWVKCIEHSTLASTAKSRLRSRLRTFPPDASLKQRLEREAKAVSKLSHPHICTLHDIGHQDGIDFLVMEYLEGETLETRLMRGALPLDQTLRYAAQIAEALARAHKAGITHRDLKPANVMLTKSGAKLMDFGLAKQSSVACRRFAFANAMIELFWVSDASEAQNQSTRRTLLWERWSGREAQASPFGICLRPVDPHDTGPRCPAWEYRPAYLSDPLFMYIGEVAIEEPMWVYLSFMRRTQREQWFIEHPIGIREIAGLTLTSPVPLRSPVARESLKVEFSQSAREQHLSSKLNLMATGEKSRWISGRTCRSSFNSDWAGNGLKVDHACRNHNLHLSARLQDNVQQDIQLLSPQCRSFGHSWGRHGL